MDSQHEPCHFAHHEEYSWSNHSAELQLEYPIYGNFGSTCESACPLQELEVPHLHFETFVHFEELPLVLNFACPCKVCNCLGIVADVKALKDNHLRNYPCRSTHYVELEMARFLHRSSSSACVMACHWQ